jgi:hypothetical protein
MVITARFENSCLTIACGFQKTSDKFIDLELSIEWAFEQLLSPEVLGKRNLTIETELADRESFGIDNRSTDQSHGKGS